MPIKDPIVIAYNGDDLYLVVSAEDAKAKAWDTCQAVIWDAYAKTFSDPQQLQVFHKWVDWKPYKGPPLSFAE